MNRSTRAFLGLVGSIILCGYGVYGLLTGYPISNLSFIPLLLAVGGLIGCVGNVIELKKRTGTGKQG
ncbi:hypothetical protein ACFO3D_13410 [Virgibacillus kekensis]|uniref:DUF3188 domain-containing protein n=1 Tax=Virgibacillus kekensis TaxID=202261 RepID=A0ABV9DM04_9BACI